jgi:hypothetical protein
MAARTLLSGSSKKDVFFMAGVVNLFFIADAV